MNLKNYLLISCLPLLILLLTSCQMLHKINRKPQSAGFRGYCPTCLLEDGNINQLQKIMQTDHKQLVANREHQKKRYEVDFYEKCAEDKGYVEGKKIKYIGGQYAMECLLKSKLSDKYEVHTEGECATGYVKGRQIKNFNGLHSIECLFENTLPDKYEVYIYGKCTKGYVPGKRLIYFLNFHSMECLLKNKLPDKYEVHTKGECAAGYTPGKKDSYIGGYSFIECILSHTIEK